MKRSNSWDTTPEPTDAVAETLPTYHPEYPATRPIERVSSTVELQPVYPPKLFDITCVIGSVYAGGDMNPKDAAFLTISEYDKDGTFSFPIEGKVLSLTVETNPPS